MEQMEQIVGLIVNNSLAAVIVAYFLWKDAKFNNQIVAVLSEIKTVLEVLKTVVK